MSDLDVQHPFFIIYFYWGKDQKLQEIYWWTVMDKKIRRSCDMVIYTKYKVKHIQNMLKIQYDLHQVCISCPHIHPNYGHKMTKNNNIHRLRSRFPRKYHDDNLLLQGIGISLWSEWNMSDLESLFNFFDVNYVDFWWDIFFGKFWKIFLQQSSKDIQAKRLYIIRSCLGWLYWLSRRWYWSIGFLLISFSH